MPRIRQPERAIVLFSGGQDSTTCLAWAAASFARIETIAFDYGQRHRVELECRVRVIDRLRREFPSWRDRLGDDHLIDLSALGQVDDRVKGLRAGGDDYLSKPYAFSELLARVEVLARRHGGRGEETVYRVGDLELDRLSHRVVRGEDEILLQPREFRLLEYLMKHAGQVVTRTMLLENVWDYHFDPQTNVIDVHISRLRSKIDKGFAQPLLHTVRGAGYMIRDGAR